MSAQEQVFCYVGTKPCGHTVAAAVDSPDHQADTFKEVAQWAEAGMKVDRVPVEQARTMLHFCKCDKKAEVKPKARKR